MFKVGDKVKVYGAVVHGGEFLLGLDRAITGEIDRIQPETIRSYPYISVSTSVHGVVLADPKQCRKLKKRHPIAKT